MAVVYELVHVKTDVKRERLFLSLLMLNHVEQISNSSSISSRGVLLWYENGLDRSNIFTSHFGVKNYYTIQWGT